MQKGSNPFLSRADVAQYPSHLVSKTIQHWFKNLPEAPRRHVKANFQTESKRISHNVEGRQCWDPILELDEKRSEFGIRLWNPGGP